jgi:quercetin dioxygenase-like cupin family protein
MRIGRPNRSAAVPPEVPDWFPGTVLQQRLITPEVENGVGVMAVWFEPGSRTRPHTHSVDQTLHVMEGVGIVATETDKRIIRAGDTVVIAAGVWHWHGALPDEAMMHLSIKPYGPPDDWTAPWKNWDTYADGASEAN